MPTKTTLPDHVGPIQPFLYNLAIGVCYDISQDTSWIYDEVKQLLVCSPTLIGYEQYYQGVRVVIRNSISYMALSMNFNTNSHIDAYNRAMSVIKR